MTDDVVDWLCIYLQGLAELQHLKKLVILNVAENQITRIPVEVLRNLRTLKALMLNNNSITTLEWLPKFPVRIYFVLLRADRPWS